MVWRLLSCDRRNLRGHERRNIRDDASVWHLTVSDRRNALARYIREYLHLDSSRRGLRERSLIPFRASPTSRDIFILNVFFFFIRSDWRYIFFIFTPRRNFETREIVRAISYFFYVSSFSRGRRRILRATSHIPRRLLLYILILIGIA